MPDRIALFSGNYNHVVDGVSLTLNRLVSFLEAQGTRVMILAPTSRDPAIEGAGTFVPVSSVPIPGRSEYRVALWPSGRTLKKLREFDPQILHVATPDLLGLRALRLSRKWNLPLVSSYHTHFSSYLDYYYLGALEGTANRYLKWFYSNCDQIYVPTEVIERMLAEWGLGDKLRIWGRGVDSTNFSPEKRSQEWRSQHGVGPDDVLVTFVGRLVKEKGVDVFADTINRLRNEGVSFQSMMVGEGKERSQLEDQLPDTIFTGHLQNEGLFRAFASSDVFLYPSDSEAFGNVIVEAMASGLPVVAAAGAGSSPHVDHGQTGQLAPARDVQAFTDATRQLIEDDALRHKMAHAARKKAETKYSWQSSLESILRYYDELLEPATT